MATATRSKSIGRKDTRSLSKSPKRHISPQRDRTQIEFVGSEHAYVDPTNSSRSILPNVFFERHDEQNLTPQADQLFHNLSVFSEDAERSWLLANMRCTKIYVKIDNVFHMINGIYSFKENQPFVLVLHGFGDIASWANWIKLAYPLAQHGDYSILFVDLPGFGRSSGRNRDQTSWKRSGPELLLGILSSFHLHQTVHTVSHCGGAATTVRTISRYPQWFRNRGLVFCNSLIGDFGEKAAGDFENNLMKFNINIVVYWIPDPDHTKQCVVYKRWNKLRQSGFRYLQLRDLDPKTQTMKLSYPPITVKNMGPGASKNKAHVYKLSDEFIHEIQSFLIEK